MPKMVGSIGSALDMLVQLEENVPLEKFEMARSNIANIAGVSTKTSIPSPVLTSD